MLGWAFDMLGTDTDDATRGTVVYAKPVTDETVVTTVAPVNNMTSHSTASTMSCHSQQVRLDMPLSMSSLAASSTSYSRSSNGSGGGPSASDETRVFMCMSMDQVGMRYSTVSGGSVTVGGVSIVDQVSVLFI
jgi:hypothetical protein